MPQTTSRRSRPIPWVLLTMALLGFVVLVYIIFVAEEVDMARSATLERELGFEYGTPYRGNREVFTIESVAPGGAMAKAGAEPQDIIEGYFAVPDFFDDLWAARGDTFEFTVERGGRSLRLKVEVPRVAGGKP